VRRTFHDLRHDNTLQTARYILHRACFLYFQTYEGQNLSHPFRRKIERDVLFQPIIRNIHILKLKLVK